jgi:ribonuclease-3
LLNFFFKKKSSEDNLQLSKFLLEKLGYRPKNIQLFIEAFTHKSFSNNVKGLKSNERLEYLGDRVIDLIVAHFLFEKYPNKDEGELTKIKSKIVSRKMLSTIGDEMKLLVHIRYSSTRSINTSTLEGNAFEALIGALYLDSNFADTQKIFNNFIIRKYVNLEKIMEEEIDFKSTILIWCQQNKLLIKFKIKEEATKSNSYMYKVIISINGKDWGIGKGKNKKEAEQNAAKETIGLIGV